ncbi:unnamed protein product [Penicillium egyptiacum]|uniref:Uncharacterized protein n=1 Tax=Penicillium egyptiacum TaxID=1303716 RepID=A0A9W4KK29_9EURO|nr:unnamed protein product [Penicillium egyptiacum]
MSAQPPASVSTSGLVNGAMCRAFAGGIFNLKASIDRRDLLASTSPLPRDEIEALSERIWETKLEFARVIRHWRDPVGQGILADLYEMLIGTLPNEDGIIP